MTQPFRTGRYDSVIAPDTCRYRAWDRIKGEYICHNYRRHVLLPCNGMDFPAHCPLLRIGGVLSDNVLEGCSVEARHSKHLHWWACPICFSVVGVSEGSREIIHCDCGVKYKTFNGD
jgi:hypothetical protein